MSNFRQDLQRAFVGRYPLLYLTTPEEERVAKVLKQTMVSRFGEGTPLRNWTCVNGLDGDDATATRDPVAALRAVMAAETAGCWLFRDLPEFFHQPEVVRALRDAYSALAGTDKVIAMSSPTLTVPALLEKEVFLLMVPPPDEAELTEAVAEFQAKHADRQLPDALATELPMALRGLTFRETEHILYRVFDMAEFDHDAILEEVYAEKEMIVRKSGFLEFVPPRHRLEDIGGLDQMKEWLEKRQGLFSQATLDQGLPLPKGMLIMGVSGCGKSLTAKVVSSLWNVPLFRLDMNLIFSGLYGSPEAAFAKALAIVESVAPVVLWVDEIENGLATASDTDGGQTHIFSAFLTWMQEKPPLIFIAATANRIQDLPAEVLRKGRFDQVFFVDLPSEEERKLIFEIHLRRAGVDPETINMDYLILDTDGWNGAEIEECVTAARVDARMEGREVESKDLMRMTAQMVPLAETMREQIKSLRDWAYKRAVPATKPAKRK